MINQKREVSGYIMVMALLLVSMITMIVVVIFNKTMIAVPFTHIMIEDHKARILSKAGVALFNAQLCKPFVKKKSDVTKQQHEKETGEQSVDPDNYFLEQLFPVLNKWQSVFLKRDIDGIDAEVSFCICCEDGKINLNKMFDFEKKEFVGEKQKEGNYKLLLEELCKRLEKHLKTKDLFGSLEKFLKKQKVPLEDITQLLEIKEWAPWKNRVFYGKGTERLKSLTEQADQKEKASLYLTDIFTVATNHATIEPWVFSAGLMQLLGLVKSFDEKDAKKGSFKEHLKSFKKRVTWKTEWNNILKPIYQKELQSLPEHIDSFLSSTFSPTTFMVLCQAKVGRAIACSCAIVERTVRAKDEKQEYAIQIKKIYWI